MKKILLLLLILGVAGGAIGYYMYQKPVEGLESHEPDVTTNSSELFEAFETAETEATAQYQGKVIAVSGNIVEILTNTDGSTTLILGSYHPVFGVKCQLDPKAELPSAYKAGDMISLKGRCVGFNTDVELIQCLLN